MVPSLSWGKCVPGQTADTPRWTDAQHTRCSTQLPRPWGGIIRKGYHIRAQPPPLPGPRARVIKWPGHRGRVSPNDRTRVQPQPGPHSCEGHPSSISSWLHDRESWESPGQSCQVKTTHPPLSGGFQPGPLCPSEPLELPGTDSPSSQTMCSSYITSSRNNTSLCPDQALGCQEQHRRPAARGARTLYNHLGAPTPPASAQNHISPGGQKRYQAWSGE